MVFHTPSHPFPLGWYTFLYVLEDMANEDSSSGLRQPQLFSVSIMYAIKNLLFRSAV